MKKQNKTQTQAKFLKKPSKLKKTKQNLDIMVLIFIYLRLHESIKCIGKMFFAICNYETYINN